MRLRRRLTFGSQLACRWALLACGALATGLAGLAPLPASADVAGLERVSGLPWASGVNAPSSENAGFAAWRERRLDVRTLFFGFSDWRHMIASARALKWAIDGGSGRLVVALGMLPRNHEGQLEQCAAGEFDAQINLLATAMLRNGARAAALAGKPVVIRLGWEANNVDGSYPWRVNDDGTNWRNCFKRWVDILNPVTNRATTPPMRQKNFLIVWNMANRGTFTYPIDNMYPGDEYVDIIGSQYYDRCPPLPDGDRYAFEARIDARTYSNNPAGPRAWLEYAKSKGKPYAIPEWGVGGPRGVCDEPGVDNPYYIEKMYEFFWKNAEHIAFEAYFNGSGGPPLENGTCHLFAPKPANPDPHSSDYLDYVQRFNPRAAAKYRALWGAGVEPPPPPPPPPPPEPPPPPPASDTLYWLRYIASYPDLIESIGPDPLAGYASWLASGKAQKRTAHFDPVGYMTRQPGIGAMLENDPIAAARHYITTGFFKGYTYSNGPQYWLRYIASHPDLIPTLRTMPAAAEAHWHNTGQFEGRTVTFDALAYLKANAEVREVCAPRDQTCATKFFINSKL